MPGLITRLTAGTSITADRGPCPYLSRRRPIGRPSSYTRAIPRTGRTAISGIEIVRASMNDAGADGVAAIITLLRTASAVRADRVAMAAGNMANAAGTAIIGSAKRAAGG